MRRSPIVPATTTSGGPSDGTNPNLRSHGRAQALWLPSVQDHTLARRKRAWSPCLGKPASATPVRPIAVQPIEQSKCIDQRGPAASVLSRCPPIDRPKADVHECPRRSIERYSSNPEPYH